MSIAPEPTPHASQGESSPVRTLVIRPVTGWSLPNLRELGQSADLIYFLAKRDVVVRYKQTAIGVLWAVLQPLLFAAVFTVFLGGVVDVPSGDTPYGLFALTGMTMWLFFATSIARCSESTIANAQLISKVYFPRVAIPIAAMMPAVVDFIAASVVLLGVLAVFGVFPTVKILLVPVVFAVAFAVALGLGFWLSATVVRYRDVSSIVSFMTILLLFITPILYPFSEIPDDYQPFYALNPLVGVLETWRWAMLPDASAPGLLLVIPAITGLILLASGLFFFHRVEHRFADLI
jgi:lipopolysaccharide transport system permease protein